MGVVSRKIASAGCATSNLPRTSRTPRPWSLWARSTPRGIAFPAICPPLIASSHSPCAATLKMVPSAKTRRWCGSRWRPKSASKPSVSRN